MGMEEAFFDLMELVRSPYVVETFVDILLCALPIWFAVMIGLVIGWCWRPRWTGLLYLGLRSKFRFLWTLPPGFGARRLWFAFTALSAFSVGRRLWSTFRKKEKLSFLDTNDSFSMAGNGGNVRDIGPAIGSVRDLVTMNDLEHLRDLIEGKERWQKVMERTAPNFSYQAWRHESETGPLTYRSRTMFKDASPELVRDFFWDDEFRPKWDPMLAYFKILEECPCTGTLVVHWIRKFPFFCSDREYIIGRRIWKMGNAYYCLTKGVPYPSMPSQTKPRRVDHYFSSWSIKPVRLHDDNGEWAACEVNLVHYEDMGIPKDIAKLGVQYGMWGTVKKLHSGLRAYQKARMTGTPLSKCALMAAVTTNISAETACPSPTELISNDDDDDDIDKGRALDQKRGVDWKWVVIGGTVALVFGMQAGIIGRALLVGGAQRLAKR